jgi:hypothetical protein
VWRPRVSELALGGSGHREHCGFHAAYWLAWTSPAPFHRGSVNSPHQPRGRDFTIALHICHDPDMIFGVSPTKDAVLVVQTRGSGETFAITSIMSIQFRARSGHDLADLQHQLSGIFDRAGKSRRSTVALLGSSSGRFKSSVEAIKAEAITELAAAESGLPVVRVTAASLKRTLGCATGQTWQARAGERFNPVGRQKNWSKGAADAAAAALKVAEGTPERAGVLNNPSSRATSVATRRIRRPANG